MRGDAKTTEQLRAEVDYFTTQLQRTTSENRKARARRAIAWRERALRARAVAELSRVR